MMDPSRSPTSVSDEGRHARERSDPESANPYPDGTDEHRTWKRGYSMPDASGEAQAVDGQVDGQVDGKVGGGGDTTAA